MLVVRLNTEKAVVVNGPAKFTILSVGRNHARVGIEAEKEVNIVRQEVLDRDSKNQGTDNYT